MVILPRRQIGMLIEMGRGLSPKQRCNPPRLQKTVTSQDFRLSLTAPMLSRESQTGN